jgi:Fe-S cluster biogenesis protein NfuA
MRMEDQGLKKRVLEALNSVRGMLQADGGDVELVDIVEDQGIVKVRLTGACNGCPMAQITLQMGIERVLKQRIPEVKQVMAVQAGTE